MNANQAQSIEAIRKRINDYNNTFNPHGKSTLGLALSKFKTEGCDLVRGSFHEEALCDIVQEVTVVKGGGGLLDEITKNRFSTRSVLKTIDPVMAKEQEEVTLSLFKGELKHAFFK